MLDLPSVLPLAWTLLGVGIAAGIGYLICGPARYRQLTRIINAQTAAGQDETENADDQYDNVWSHQGASIHCPTISVVAFGKPDTDQIGAFLHGIADQDYPNVEIIIVVDGSAREASNLAETFDGAYPDLYFTFVPPEAQNLSRRKLGNTMGIKKATGDIILTTLTNIEIPSRQWLSLMAGQFTGPDVEIVLGGACMDMRGLRGPKRWYRRFDTLLTVARWMLAAIDGRPYRGDGANLAFRRDLFFRNSGYGNNYYLHSGDDDIFVSQVATATNSRFQFARQARVLVDWGEGTRRQWISLKQRYRFASRFLSAGPRLRQGVIDAMLWLCTLSLAACVALSLCTIAQRPLVPLQLILPGVAMACLLALWGLQIALYRLMAACLGSPRLWWAVPLFYLLHAPADILFALRYRRSSRRNFTYRR